MSLGSKLLTGALAVSAFAFAASAQDTKVTPREGGQRGAQKEMRHDGPHEGEFGRHGGPGAFGLRGIEPRLVPRAQALLAERVVGGDLLLGDADDVQF